MAYIIGVDLGTSSVKVTAVDEKGNIAAGDSNSYDILRPKKDYAEQDPAQWWQQTLSSLKTVLNKLNNSQGKVDIKAISLSGQMHGLVCLDKEGKSLENAIIWSDNRTAEEVEYIKKNLSKKELKLLANSVVSNFTAAKILWLKNNRPELWSKVDKILLPKDYIAYKLSGKFFTDRSDASATLLFDIEKREWAEDIIKKFNISRDIFPELIDPGQVSAAILETTAEKLNIANKDCSIVLAGGDAPVSAWASGATSAGQACISLGTAGQIILPTENFVVEENFRVHTMQYVKADLWFVMGAILSAGYNFKWWFKEILQSKKNEGEILTELEAELEKLNPAANGVIFLPFLHGERSPLNDLNASAMFFGLKGDHNQLHLIRAVMEGVAFALKSNFEIMTEMGLSIEKIYLTGGGAESSLWAQILSDVLNKEVLKSNNVYGTSYGAALLAAQTVAFIDDVDALIDSNLSNSHKYEPQEDQVKIYQKFYQLYKELYYDNKDKMKRLAELSKED